MLTWDVCTRKKYWNKKMLHTSGEDAPYSDFIVCFHADWTLFFVGIVKGDGDGGLAYSCLSVLVNKILQVGGSHLKTKSNDDLLMWSHLPYLVCSVNAWQVEDATRHVRQIRRWIIAHDTTMLIKGLGSVCLTSFHDIYVNVNWINSVVLFLEQLRNKVLKNGR